MPSWQSIAIILSILAILPIWIIDVAPLSDWPFHLAVSREAFLLLTNQVQSDFYRVDFSFLGYSLPHAILIFLQYFTDIFTAGKIFLSLLFLMSIFCWYWAFEFLDSSKKGYFLLGLVANQSAYYFLGMVSFLFAVHIGILWLAVSFTKKLPLNQKYILFLSLAILVYLSHGYVFFLLSVPIFAWLFYDAVINKQKSAAVLVIFNVVLLLFAGANTFSNNSLGRDLTYSVKINSCNLEQSVLFEHSLFDQKKNFTLEFFFGVYSNTFSILPIGYFIPLLSNPIALLSILTLFILLILKLSSLISSEKFIFHPPAISGLAINKNYALTSAYFYAHFLFIPFSAASIYFFNERSIPFLTAFAALSFKNENWDKIILNSLLAIVVVSLIFQALSFYSNISEQEKIIYSIKEIASKIPNDSAVMIFSSDWNSRIYTPLSPVQKNPQYHALLLIYNPNIYVSNMFLFQDTFILRSNFKIFDEFRVWYSSNKELDDAVYNKCYSPIPAEFDYYISRNMALVENKNITDTLR